MKTAINEQKKCSASLWDQETVRSSRTTRTKIPLKSLISEGFFLFFVYCGAGFERTHHTNISLPTNHQHRYILVCLLL